jgi:23S rRNA (cytosine1962-C5)-methyltransferase
VTIDRYGAFALVQCYVDAAREGLERLAEALRLLGAQGVHVKYRPKQSNTLVDTRRDVLAPRAPLAGEAAPDTFTVRELGLRYRVKLTDGLSTGIFLDQRENRAWVRSLSAAKNARVLNLFAYTCGFSVSAVAGGASQVVSVDASQGALAWGRANLEDNALDGSKALFVTADAFGWLEGAKARGDRFACVVLDPPSYSTTHDGPRFSASSDYEALLALALTVLAPKGKLLACSNHRKITARRFRAMCERAAQAAFGARAKVYPRQDPTDFPPQPGHDSHLKQCVVERT